jgi:ethanolamine utilization microcompartment shell protein EutS
VAGKKGNKNAGNCHSENQRKSPNANSHSLSNEKSKLTTAHPNIAPIDTVLITPPPFVMTAGTFAVGVAGINVFVVTAFEDAVVIAVEEAAEVELAVDKGTAAPVVYVLTYLISKNALSYRGEPGPTTLSGYWVV